MSFLSQISPWAYFAGVLVGLVVIVFRFLRNRWRFDPLRCPKCGESRSRSDGWTDVGVPGQDGILVYRRCECCQHRWGVSQPETGPSPYRNIP